MVTLGIDEVGRGCWAGPVVAGAVILKEALPGLRDSKKLSKRRRQKLSAEIQLCAVAVGLGWAEAEEIDGLGLTAAVRLAMQRALDQITGYYDSIIIDGNMNFLYSNPKAKAIIRADDTVPAVSAASIIAKVARDAHMTTMGLKYPEYGFEKHVGYGTALHQKQLRLHGTCGLHRMSVKPVRALLQ